MIRASRKASWRPKKGKWGPVKWLDVSVDNEAQLTRETKDSINYATWRASK